MEAELFVLAKLALYITCAGYLLWFIKPKGSFGGSGGGGQTVVEKNEIPGYIQDFSKENIQKAKDIANTPYQQYTGERIAGFTPTQTEGMGLTQQNVGAYQPAMNLSNLYAANAGQQGAGPQLGNQFQQALSQAQGTYGDAANANFGNVDLSAYMNPYTQQVTRRAIEEAQRAGEITRNQMSGQLAKAGGYGGARHGVVESEQLRNQGQLINDLALQGNAAAFNSAMQGYGLDQQTRLAGAQGMSNLYNLGLQQQQGDRAYDIAGRQLGLGSAAQLAGNAGLQSQLGYQDAAALMDIGEQQRQLQQLGLDVGYTDFLNQQNYPIEMLNVLLATQQGTPYSTTRTQNASGGGASGAQNFGAIAGGVGALAGGAAMLM